MYTSPKLVRYGKFRDLTQAGWNGANDHMFFHAISGCNLWACPPSDPGDGGVGGQDTGGSR